MSSKALSRSINHTNGNAFLQDGVIYYSPNSSRRITVPTRTDALPYPFPARTTRIKSFQEPRWWRTLYPYLPFLPLRPSFAGAVFGDLSNWDMRFQDDVEGHSLEQGVIERWVQLEDRLIQTVFFLRQKYIFGILPFLVPIPLSLLGFKKTFRTTHGSRSRANISRDWFGMWMGVIAFLIANTETHHPMEMQDDKNWFAILSRCGVPQSWLGSLQTLDAAVLTPDCPRAGVILDCLLEESHQPRVEWFCAFNIPVWYPWTQDHDRAVDHGHNMEYMCPPPHVLQMATTFLSCSPSSPSVHNQKLVNDMTSKEFKAACNACIQAQPWKKFFETRDMKNEIRHAKETPIDGERCQNRERNPPTTSAEVYKWDWGEKTPTVLVRVRVEKARHSDVLGSYGKAQRIYNPFENMWDVSEYFGEDDSGSEDSFFEPQEDFNTLFPHVDPREEEAAHGAFFESRALLPSSSDTPLDAAGITSELQLLPPTDELDIVQHIMLHYGFLPPIPVPLGGAHVSTSDWNNFLKSIGLRIGQYSPVPGLSPAMVSFVKEMLNPKEDLESSDLIPGHFRSLDKQEILKWFHPFNGLYLLLLFSESKVTRDVDFDIALTSANTALYVYRLLQTDSFSLSSLAIHLAEKGIRFLTLLKLETIPSSMTLSGIEVVIPQRLHDYVFTTSNYEVYVQEQSCLLRLPRGCAALLHGGIVSRIAREHLLPDSAGMGPLSAVMDFRIGVSFEDAQDSRVFWDDQLTAKELNIICGAHDMHTGRRGQLANVSWWPISTIWNAATTSYNWHHWMEWDEVWYQQRLMSIRSGDEDGVPWSQKKWRENVRGPGAWRKMVKNVTTEAGKLF